MLVTVCDKCLTAACWQGLFMCWESGDAGTTQKNLQELKDMQLEHPSWWLTDKELAEGKGRRI